MADTNGKKTGKKTLRYFFLDGKLTDDGPTTPLLHKKLHINLGADTITTWCYPLGKRVAYTYSHVKKFKDSAFTTTEVSKMLMRHKVQIENAILDGNIPAPQCTYSIDEHRRRYKYMWHEKDILAAHAYFMTVHRGRPRNDGLVTPQKLPTVRELRAIIRNRPILYIKDGDEFKPVWEAKDFD